ncbi:hypothetical protein [Acinetobacter sp. ANC 4648]|uniref:hypothetical protein n=1 Tax=Acinetobacter sp. ANC 4648 TaxID=1977875 RepID=UPI000A35493B|nr:hypothetical protein [Acinetobacter sp. ANC 4648]OTG83047.1 hypothetical protein B9T27_07195 [Acinetobacter sp. ANC 4648]
MPKMIDVFEQNLVQNFLNSLTTQTEPSDELMTGIMNASDIKLKHAISDFFSKNDAITVAQALDIPTNQIQAIQIGSSLKKDNLVDTAKIVALCLALESDALKHVEVADSLQDYPM